MTHPSTAPRPRVCPPPVAGVQAHLAPSMPHLIPSNAPGVARCSLRGSLALTGHSRLLDSALRGLKRVGEAGVG